MKNKIETFTLDNGLQVVLENIPHRTSASMGIWVPMGSRFEQNGEYGFSHFTEHMLFKGTKNRTYRDISVDIDRLGGYMNASTSREITNYYITLSSKFISTGLDVLSDMFFDSLLADDDFNVEKKVILEEIKMGEDNPDEYLFDLFYEDAFGDTPIGRPIAGSLRSIEDSTRNGLNSFYQNHYGCEGSVVSIAGGLFNSEAEKKNLIQTIEKYFNRSKIQQVGKPSLDKAERSIDIVNGKIKHHYKQLEQVLFAVGLPGVSVNGEAETAVQIFNHMMGGTMSSRLFRILREENGLCYSVGTFHSQYFQEGLWGLYCGTSKKSYYEALDLAINEVARALKEEPPVKEIEESKSGLAGSIELSMESVMRRASYNAKSLLYFKGLRDWQDDVEKIEKTEPGQAWNNVSDLWKNKVPVISSLGDLDEAETERELRRKYLKSLA